VLCRTVVAISFVISSFALEEQQSLVRIRLTLAQLLRLETLLFRHKYKTKGAANPQTRLPALSAIRHPGLSYQATPILFRSALFVRK